MSEVRHPASARTARAARYHGVKDVRLEQIQVPAPGAGEVTIAVSHTGVCGSDLHEYFSAQTVTPTEPHPLTGATLPVVLGHEFAGVVVEVGAGVTERAVGDRVAVRPTYSCGECASCLRGHPNTCTKLAFHGLSAHGGGLADFTNVAASMTFALPDDVSMVQGALVEPMAVAYHGVRLAVTEQTRVAFVGGAGPIGLGAIAALRSLGVATIIASDPSASRREAALRLGADEALDPAVTTLGEALAGRTLDVAIEAAGVAAVVETAVAELGPRGTVVLLGIHERPMPFDPTSLLYREVRLAGSSTYTDDDYRAVIAAMAAGGYDPSGWVETRPLEELHSTFEELRTGGPVKVLIELQPS